jgi:hypothetical protein
VVAREFHTAAGAHLFPAPGDDAMKRVTVPCDYDPDFCGKAVKGAACVCVGLIIVELLVLLLVHPSDDRCPGWILYSDQPSAISFWVFAGMFTVLPAACICNIALRWDHYRIVMALHAHKLDEGISAVPPTANPDFVLLPFNWVWLLVVISWCLFCAFPLCWMLGQCTELYKYLAAFQQWYLTAFRF